MVRVCGVQDLNLEFSAKVANDYGKYQECIADTNNNYYLLTRQRNTPTPEDVNRENLDEFYNAPDVSYVGICVTAVCTEGSLIEIYNQMFLPILPNNQRNYLPVEVTNSKEYFKKVKEDGFDPILIAGIVAFGFLILVSIIITALKVLRRRGIHRGRNPSFLDIFDFRENSNKILSPPRFIQNPITQIFTVSRGLGIISILPGHILLESLIYTKRVTKDPNKAYADIRSEVGFGLMQIGTFWVSLYVFMGGFVGAISAKRFLNRATIQARRSKILTIFYLYIKRMARFFPMLLFTLIFFWKALDHAADSPPSIVVSVARKESCQPENIFMELAFLGEEFRTLLNGNSEGCVSWDWYLQSDLACYFLVCVVISFSGRSKKIAGLVGLILLSVVSSIIQILDDYNNFGILSNDFLHETFVYRLKMYAFGALLGFLMTRDAERDGPAVDENRHEKGKFKRFLVIYDDIVLRRFDFFKFFFKF